MKTDCVVLVPHAQPFFTKAETVSVHSCFRHLGEYPLVLVCGQSMDISGLLAQFPGFQVERFPDSYFQSTKSYSLLCRDAAFYIRFQAYPFVLFCQPDTYVFSNQLEAWCARNYDYVGAPWPDLEFLVRSNRAVAKLPGLRFLLRRVGNGGFSLRKTATFLRLSQKLRWLVRFSGGLQEDLFWCQLAPWFAPGMKFPRWRDALNFAFDVNPATAYRLNGKRLPFGAHAWAQRDLDFWLDKIPELVDSPGFWKNPALLHEKN